MSFRFKRLYYHRQFPVRRMNYKPMEIQKKLSKCLCTGYVRHVSLTIVGVHTLIISDRL
jgi:hypothetical protein